MPIVDVDEEILEKGTDCPLEWDDVMEMNAGR